MDTYKRLAQLDQEQFNDEMWQNYAHLVNFDIDRVRSYTRNLTSGWSTEFEDLGDGWKRVAKSNTPENYGFNVIAVEAPIAGSTVTVNFRGEAEEGGYVAHNIDCAGWRYGFVAVNKDDKVAYGDICNEAEGSVSYTTPEGAELKKLWFVVMGAPTRHWSNYEYDDDAQWPYSIKVTAK